MTNSLADVGALENGTEGFHSPTLALGAEKLEARCGAVLHNSIVTRDLVAGATDVALKEQRRVGKVEVRQQPPLLIVPATQAEVGAQAVGSAARVRASARLKTNTMWFKL